MSPQRRSPRDVRPSRRGWILGAILLLVALVAYAAWSALSTRTDLMSAQKSAAGLVTALAEQDTPAAAAELEALQRSFGDARRRSDGPLWSLASALPLIGDDARAVRTLAAVGDDLSAGTLSELVAESEDRLADRLVPRRGKVNLRAIEDLGPTISRARRNLDDASGRLRAADSASLSGWVQPAYEVFSTKLSSAAAGMAAADRTVRVLPTMLGKTGPRSYLVMFGNNAEIRTTGGLPGAFAIVTADKGRVRLARHGIPADIGKFPRPVLPQSEAEKKIYYSQIAEYFQDTNFTPEFPRTAELVREMWRRSQGQVLNGVLSIDAVTLSYLIRATGTLDANNGVQLTAKNATKELLNNVYLRLGTNEEQNLFFESVAQLVFDKVTRGVDSPVDLIEALGQGTREGRIYAHDFDPTVQRVLAGSTVAGELVGGDPRVPQVGVYLNDATGSKMSYYLRTKVRVRPERCSEGQQQLTGTADLTYTEDSPPVAQLNEFITGPGTFGTPRGEQLVLVRIYGPLDGELGQFRVAGSPTSVEVVNDRGRPVATTVVQLRRGETVRVGWRIRSGPEQDRDARLSVTPGMTSRSAVTRIPSVCEAS